MHDVILSKHLDDRDVGVNSIPRYDNFPELINVNASEENVEITAKCASGSTGPLEP